MSYSEAQRRNAALVKQRVDYIGVLFGVDLPEAEEPDPAAGVGPSNAERVNRPEQPQRSSTIATTSDAVALVHGDISHLERDPTVQHILMYPSGQGEPIRFIATLDSGTSDNWISSEALQRLQIKRMMKAPTEWRTFSGKSFKSEDVVEISWNGVSNRKTRRSTFRVTKSGVSVPFDVILGSKFIFAEDIFSFNENAWILTKKPITKDEEAITKKRRIEDREDIKLLEDRRRNANLPFRKKRDSEAAEKGNWRN